MPNAFGMCVAVMVPHILFYETKMLYLRKRIDAMKRIVKWFRERRLQGLRQQMLLHPTKFNTYDSIIRAIHFMETGEFDPVKFPNAESFQNDTYL